MNQSKNLVRQVWALIGLVFVLGGLTGAGVTNLYHSRRASLEPAAGNPSARRDRMRERMKQELNLTDEQAAQIQVIMEESRAGFRTASDGCPQLKEVREQSAARIRTLLNPEQQKKFDEVRARREEERGKR